MPGFVVDASVGFAWVYPAQASADTDRLLEQVASGIAVTVPALWFLEMANALMVAQRRHRLTSAQRKSALAQLKAMQFTVDEEAAHTAFADLSDLADKHGLSLYDAAYLDVAIRRDLALASRDEPLRAAAKRCGVTLV